jgi:hypothetical protein
VGVRIRGRGERGGGKGKERKAHPFPQARVTMVAWASKHALLFGCTDASISQALIKLNFGISFFDAKKQTKTVTQLNNGAMLLYIA